MSLNFSGSIEVKHSELIAGELNVGDLFIPQKVLTDNSEITPHMIRCAVVLDEDSDIRYVRPFSDDTISLHHVERELGALGYSEYNEVVRRVVITASSVEVI